MNNKAYVVCIIAYEYNDEVYYTPESGGLIPENVFLDPDKANEYCATKNAEFLELLMKTNYRGDSEIGDYAYEVSDIFNDPDRISEIAITYDSTYKDDHMYQLAKIIPKMTHADKFEVMKLCNLDGYVIREVELK